MNKLVLIDGNAIIHRAYHAMPALSTPKGEPIGAVQGFLNILLKIIEDLKPTHLAVAWDRKEKTFRQKMFKEYQSQRPALDDDLSSQFEKVGKAIESFGIQQFSKAGFEADDVIGTLAQRAIVPENQKSKISKAWRSEHKNQKEKIDEIVIVTGDKDQFQLVNEKVKVYMPVKGLSEAKLFDSVAVKEKMGVLPSQIIDLKAFMGDNSDNYPGVFGIGPKTALDLLTAYGTYTNTYNHLSEIKETVGQKLIKGKESGDVSYTLATIITDVPLEVDFELLSKWSIGSEETVKVFEEFGFRTLMKRIKGEKDLAVNKKPTLDQIKKTVLHIAERLKGKQYAIRGTASLVLQGIDMGVDDIDILSDKETAHICNEFFKSYVIEKVEYKESEKFKSYFGKLVIDEVQVEVMGEWQIKLGNKQSLPLRDREKGTGNNWSKIYNASDEEVIEIEIEKQKIRVTQIETELEVSAAMGRWNEFHKIKKQLTKKDQQSLF